MKRSIIAAIAALSLAGAAPAQAHDTGDYAVAHAKAKERTAEGWAWRYAWTQWSAGHYANSYRHTIHWNFLTVRQAVIAPHLIPYCDIWVTTTHGVVTSTSKDCLF